MRAVLPFGFDVDLFGGGLGDCQGFGVLFLGVEVPANDVVEFGAGSQEVVAADQ